MSQFNWCHGPHCHTYHTLGRIRGVKGNKVLRTRKISQTHSHYHLNDWLSRWWAYFCDERCRTDYIHKHLTAIMRLEPRTEPLETSIEVQQTKELDWQGNPYINKKIVEA